MRTVADLFELNERVPQDALLGITTAEVRHLFQRRFGDVCAEGDYLRGDQSQLRLFGHPCIILDRPPR